MANHVLAPPRLLLSSTRAQSSSLHYQRFVLHPPFAHINIYQARKLRKRQIQLCQSLKKQFLQEKKLDKNLRAPFVGLFDGLSGQIANY